MICVPCRKLPGISGAGHESCPEQARQRDTRLTETERAGSTLCDCQHMPPMRRRASLAGIPVVVLPGMPDGVTALVSPGHAPVILRVGA
jgi:hypothetical protein